MNNRVIKKITAVPHAVFRVAGPVLIFTGMLVLLIASLAMISGGMITIPAAVMRIAGKGSFFISDLPELTMLFAGGFLLLGGIALLLTTACRICPPAADYAYRLIFGKDKK